jgi:hypothetical protein
MSMLKIALCSEDGEGDESLPEDLYDDSDLVSSRLEMEVADKAGDAQEMAIESLLIRQHALSALKDTSLGMSAMESAIAALRLNQPMVALESYAGNNPQEYLSIASEGFVDNVRNGFDAYFQTVVLQWKHQNDIVIDFFRSTSEKLNKYSVQLEKTEAEFNEKKDKFREGSHFATLAELWYFFSTKHGQSKNLIHDLDFDTKASEHILKNYLTQVLAELSKLNSIVSGNPVTDEKELSNMLSKIEQMKPIEDLFGSEYLGDRILFNVTSVELEKAKSMVRPVTIANKEFRTLADMSRKQAIEESRSFGHTMRKATSQGAIGQLIMGYKRQDFELTTDEISKIIAYGKKYIANVDEYVSMSRKIEIVLNDTIRGIEKLKDRSNGLTGGAAGQAMHQVANVIGNFKKAVTSPAMAEVTRSIKGAKYCNYLALRMIFNASKYIS